MSHNPTVPTPQGAGRCPHRPGDGAGGTRGSFGGAVGGCPEASPFAAVTTGTGVWCVKLPGRFRSLRVEELAVAAWSFRARAITRRQWRVWFALQEMLERRRYTQHEEGGRHREASYGLVELRSLVGGPKHAAALRSLGRDVAHLSRLGLVTMEAKSIRFARSADDLEPAAFGPEGRAGFDRFFSLLPNRRRRVPVPRRLTRALASGMPSARMVLVVALLLRTLHWHGRGGADGKGAYRMDGRAKLSWVAEAFGVSRRALSDARAALVAQGLVRKLQATQWQLNRWGQRVMLDVAALGPEGETPGVGCATESASVANSGALKSAPPDLNRSSSPYGREQNNKKPAPLRAGTPVGGRKKLPEPSLRNVQPEDLEQLPRALCLHREAVAEGLVRHGEDGRLQFLAVVERARSEGLHPERLLVWLLRRGRTDWVSAADEERAVARLRAMQNPMRSPGARPTDPGPADRPPMTADELMVQACRITAAKLRLDPYQVARSKRGWTPERWAAAAERVHDRERSSSHRQAASGSEATLRGATP